MRPSLRIQQGGRSSISVPHECAVIACSNETARLWNDATTALQTTKRLGAGSKMRRIEAAALYVQELIFFREAFCDSGQGAGSRLVTSKELSRPRAGRAQLRRRNCRLQAAQGGYRGRRLAAARQPAQLDR